MPGAITYTPGAVGEIVVSQPDRRNAVSAAMWRDLGGAVRAAASDPSARVVVVSGEGEHFAAGADISEFERVYATAESAADYTRVMLESLAALEDLGKPTVAAIRGACVGGGCSIASACDFRFAAASARFAVTPGKLGLVYSLADTRRLARAAGVQAAKDLLLTGRTIGAEEAFACGFVDRLYADEALADGVAAFAAEAIALSPASLAATKEMFRMLRLNTADDDRRALGLVLDAFSGADFREGYRAFLEKRPPRF